MLFWSWEAWHILPTYKQILTIMHHYICIIQSCGRNEKKQTVKQQEFMSVIRCLNAVNIEYPYSLYLLVLTVRDVSNTGTQTHLLSTKLFIDCIVHVVNNIILILV
jgi:hypothetical protein